MSAAEDTTLRPAVPHVEYARMKARAEDAEAALVELTSLHHRTIVPSRMHDARGGGSWADCGALTCRATAELVPDAAADWRVCDRPRGGMSAEFKRWICTAPQESIDRPKSEVCDDCVRPVAAHLCREGLGVPLTAPGVDERFWMVRAAAVTLPMLRSFKVADTSDKMDRVRVGQTALIVKRLREQQRATASVVGLDTAAELIEHWFADDVAARS